MLKLLPKIRQIQCVVNTREWATARKTCRFATTSASGCRACCSRTTGTAAEKRRSNLPLATNFQLVENALNDLHQVTFCNITTFCHRQIWQDLRFYCIFVQYFVHERGVYLGFTAQRDKLLSIYRKIKSQDDFIT